MFRLHCCGKERNGTERRRRAGELMMALLLFFFFFLSFFFGIHPKLKGGIEVEDPRVFHFRPLRHRKEEITKEKDDDLKEK